jgi:hypothetical protein
VFVNATAERARPGGSIETRKVLSQFDAMHDALPRVSR